MFEHVCILDLYMLNGFNRFIFLPPLCKTSQSVQPSRTSTPIPGLQVKCLSLTACEVFGKLIIPLTISGNQFWKYGLSLIVG